MAQLPILFIYFTLTVTKVEEEGFETAQVCVSSVPADVIRRSNEFEDFWCHRAGRGVKVSQSVTVCHIHFISHLSYFCKKSAFLNFFVPYCHIVSQCDTCHGCHTCDTRPICHTYMPHVHAIRSCHKYNCHVAYWSSNVS
jgi:hypothetical protein